MTKPGPKPLTVAEWVLRVRAFPGITVAEANSRWRGFGKVASALLTHPEIETTKHRHGLRLWPADLDVPRVPTSRQAQRKRNVARGAK